MIKLSIFLLILSDPFIRKQVLRKKYGGNICQESRTV